MPLSFPSGHLCAVGLGALLAFPLCCAMGLQNTHTLQPLEPVAVPPGAVLQGSCTGGAGVVHEFNAISF